MGELQIRVLPKVATPEEGESLLSKVCLLVSGLDSNEPCLSLMSTLSRTIIVTRVP